MHLGGPIGEEIWAGVDKAVELLGHLAVSYNHHSHTANATAVLVGRLKIYGCKIFHRLYGLNDRAYPMMPKREWKHDAGRNTDKG